jgi:hypothetical protein
MSLTTPIANPIPAATPASPAMNQGICPAFGNSKRMISPRTNITPAATALAMKNKRVMPRKARTLFTEPEYTVSVKKEPGGRAASPR